MAAHLHRFLRKSSPLRIASTFNKHQPSDIFSPLSSHAQNPSDRRTPNPHAYFLEKERSNIPFSQTSLQIYPSFLYGYLLNPIPPSGLETSEADEASDAQTIWADSVKKKRKKKMNKHKYKKLRKRLRRKT